MGKSSGERGVVRKWRGRESEVVRKVPRNKLKW